MEFTNKDKNDHQISPSTRRAWLIFACTAFTISLYKSISISLKSGSWLKPVFPVLAGYFTADLITGLYHWIIDNYGNRETRFIGSQVANAQDHHKQPWTFTKNTLEEQTYHQAIAVSLIMLPVNLLCDDPSWLGFLGVLMAFSLFSQQFHAWAHTPKHKLPWFVVRLQDSGIILTRERHAKHHKRPFNGSYCIVSGLCNVFLDKSKVLVAVEVVLFRLFGLRPISWGDEDDED